MINLILKRGALGILTLLLVSALIFAGTQLLPGDVASAILGQNATPGALAALRQDLGLDLPAWQRYITWLSGFVTGDLGMSLANRQPVADLLWPRFWNTMALAGYAAVVSVPIAVLSVMDQAYVETAFLKGLRTRRVVLNHALPNAAAPIVNVVAFNVAYLITGVVLVEAIFNYNGLGRFMVDAVAKRDLPLVQAAAMVFGAAYVILNSIADIAAIALNPRLRHPR